jgi:hypothetical protein
MNAKTVSWLRAFRVRNTSTTNKRPSLGVVPIPSWEPRRDDVARREGFMGELRSPLAKSRASVGETDR